MPSLHKLWFCCIALLGVPHTQTWQSEQWITEVYILFSIHHNVDIELAKIAGFSEMLTNPQEKHQGTTTKLHPIKVLQAGVWMLADREQRSRKVWMNLGRKKTTSPQICKQTLWEKSHRNKLHDLLTGKTFQPMHISQSGAWNVTWSPHMAAVMHEMRPETFDSVIKGMIYSI